MTDKVQKIKDWISREQDGLMDVQGNFEYPEHQGEYNVLCNLDAYIDSLQEEPVIEELEEAADSYIKTHGEILGFGRQTFKDGAKWQKKQMMAKAIDATCFALQGAALFTFRLPAGSYLVGLKVKVIVINED